MKNNNNQLTLPNEQIDFVVALYSSGKFNEAIEKINFLNKHYPNVPLLFNILGACYKSLGQLENSEKMFKAAFTIKPDYAEAYFNHGFILKSLGKLDLAIVSYKKALVLIPNYPDAHNNLGNALRELGQLDEAIESYEWAIAYKPEFAEAHNNLGIIQSDIGRLDLALKHYEKAISINAIYVDSIFNLGIAYKQLGNKILAAKNLEKVIELSPKHVKAHRNLSVIKQYKHNDPHIAQMESLLSAKDLNKPDIIDINLALSKVYEDLGDIDKQFKFLNEGNKRRKEQLNYSFDSSLKLHKTVKKLFTLKLPIIKKSSYKALNFRPIFIVGMPRSGTSLVEQILSSHKEVYGAGELEYFSKNVAHLVTNNNSNILKEDILNVRNQYSSKIYNLKVKQTIITDKMPANFRYIGFILAAFPEAKIIHLKRDARATCWSIYKHYFDSKGSGFTFDQNDLARYYGLYHELMIFWHNLFPNQIYDINYESLTINQEEESRKLLDYCDLSWDKNCLNFYDNKRGVKTASSLQVRQKMYQGSSDIWKKYESYLQPLIKGLSSF